MPLTNTSMVALFGFSAVNAFQFPVIGTFVPGGIGPFTVGGFVQEQGSPEVGVVPIGVPHW